MFLFCLYVNAGSSLLLTNDEFHYLQEKKIFKLCVDPRSAPFEEITPDGIYKGITADLIYKIAKRIGFSLEVKHVLTWEDSLKLAKSGQCDILTFMSPSEEDNKWLLFSEPLFTEPNVIITREDHAYIENLSTLTDQSIVIPIISDLFSRINKEYINLAVIPVGNKEEALNMVSMQKADMTIYPMIAAAYAIKKERLFNLKISGNLEYHENTIRLSITNNETLLLSLLNKAIATISMEEKELIVNKHISIVIEKGISKHVIQYIILGIVLFFFVLTTFVLWNTYLRKKIAQEVAKSQAIQNKLFQASKEAEIGRIIANISHQWRGILAKIGALNLFTLVQLKNNQPIDRAFITNQSEEIGKLLDFMSNTMQDFLEFYKPSKNIEEFLLIETVNHARGILEPKIQRSHLTFIIEGKNHHKMIGIRNQWVHVWLNLIDNTINAALKNNVKLPYFKIIFSHDEIDIFDNAGGMPSLTNESDMGLGIYMCIELVKKHGGKILYNTIPNGLNVKISFIPNGTPNLKPYEQNLFQSDDESA